MPSGPKKRKALKKKLKPSRDVNKAPSVSIHSHGGEDVKQQSDKIKEIGDVTSPAAEGGVWDVGSQKASNFCSVENQVANMKIENEFNNREGRIDHYRSSSRSSSSSSGDADCEGLKISQAAMSDNSVVDDSGIADSSEAIHCSQIHVSGGSEKVSMPDKPAEVDITSPADIPGVPCLVEYVLNQNGEKKLVSSNEKVLYFTDTTVDHTSDSKKHMKEDGDTRLPVPFKEIATANYGAEQDRKIMKPSPCSEQTTSWLSCCGLFELLSRS